MAGADSPFVRIVPDIHGSNLQEESERMSETGKEKSKGLRRFGALLIVAGLLLMAGGTALILYNIWDNRRAGREADIIQETIDSELEKISSVNSPVPSSRQDSKSPDEDLTQDHENWLAEQEMPTVLINGHGYIGTLEIPSIGLRLPVMDSWDYEKLKTNPCLYSGSYYTDDMVICGHNYQSHFGPIRGVAIDADVYFITMDKAIYHYTVCNREIVKPTSVEKMIRNMNNGDPDIEQFEDWDLTLFTCTPGGRTRCAGRCIRVE